MYTEVLFPITMTSFIQTKLA